MTRSLIQFYALAVCFCALMCLVVSLGLGIWDAVRIAVPGFTVDSSSYWQTDEQFLMYNPDKKDLAPEERAALREEYRRAAIASERASATRRIVFLLIILAIDVAVYVLHWRLARQLESRTAGGAAL